MYICMVPSFEPCRGAADEVDGCVLLLLPHPLAALAMRGKLVGLMLRAAWHRHLRVDRQLANVVPGFSAR